VAATVPEGEPDIGTDGWLTPRLSRALLYRSGDGTLVGRETAPAAPAHCCRLRRSPVAWPCWRIQSAHRLVTCGHPIPSSTLEF